MDVWGGIRYLHANEGLSGRAIVARLGVARQAVAKALGFAIASSRQACVG